MRKNSYPKQRRPLTNNEREYIDQNAHNTSVLKMAEHLKRGTALIYLYLDDQGIKPFSSQPKFGSKRTPDKKKPGYFDISKMKQWF